MLKTEASAERTTLRSASPHRNAYRAEFQALKKAFDQPRQDGGPSKPRDPERVRQPRGRQYGAHVSRIKDMFMQMGTENTRSRGREQTPPQKLAKPTNFVNQADGSVVKFQHGVSTNSKFSETRKMFEQSSRDTSQSPVSSFGREKRGSHEHLDDWRGARSNRGSTDSLDSLCSRNDASSPTVSQLSAVFENTDPQQGPGPPFRRGHGAGRVLSSPDGLHRQGELSEDDAGSRHRNRAGARLPVSSSSEDLLSPSPLSEETVPEKVERCDRVDDVKDHRQNSSHSDGPSKAVAPAEAVAVGTNSTEANDPVVSETPTDPKVPKVTDDGESKDQPEETGEEYSGNERVIFNADGDACYQGWGESCTDLEDDLYGDEDVCYDPGSEITEIPGLPEEGEEDVPKKRKIRFSTAPMTVFNTYSNEDYDRRNEEVDPVASSAEYELEKRVEKLELFPVELEKDDDGLGISIIGMGVGADAGLEKLGIFVKTVIEGGAAERDGRIKVNDQIVEVDGTSLVGVTQSFAASVLRNTQGVVRFVIGRERPGQQSEVAQLISQTLEQERKQREMMEQQYAQYDADDDETGEYATDEEDEVGPAVTGGEMTIEVFDLPENEEIISPSELDATKLYQKFRELQIKHAVTEAEIQKLKSKLQAVEKEKQRWEKEKVQLKQSIEDNKDRMLKLESYWIEAQTLCHTVNEHLKEAQNQYQALEKKYNKAKKLIKDFQQKEAEHGQREEAERKRMEDVEKAHLVEIQGLQVRIATLEAELMQLMKQNCIQVNNNNNSSQSQARLVERLCALQSPQLAGVTREAGPSWGRLDDGVEMGSAEASQGDRDSHRRDSSVASTSTTSSSGPETGNGRISRQSAEASPQHQPGADGKESPDAPSPSHSTEEKPSRRTRGLGSTEHSAENSPERKSKCPSYNDNLSFTSSSSAEVSGPVAEPKISGRSHTLVLSSDEILDDGLPMKLHQWQNRSVPEWTCQQVSRWLIGLGLEQYIPQFTAKRVDGEQLLQLDSGGLKVLGVESSQDRALIKKKVKELKALMDKARRNREKLEKQREKLRKKEQEQTQKQARKAGSRSSEPAGGATE
ncbi:neurabin-1 isoform X2 [Denticeps clupeoides]|uniref:Neurabin-1 n=1 Tax=Denticeps clupeoides TaxID=299321 RepID=A0AAY4E3I0_9TELE|nr:neurabin-1 isoform X2 [Denticeps clupeoides]